MELTDLLLLIPRALQYILIFYFGFGTCYILFFSLAGLGKRTTSNRNGALHHRIAVLIPGYKEDSVIIEAAEEALKQDYPDDSYDVIVIADSFQKSTLDILNSLKIRVIEVSFEQSTKAKALNQALSVLPEDGYDLAVILDADNIM